MAIDDQRSPSDGGMKKQPSLTMGHGVLQGICYMPNSFKSFTSPPIFPDPSERSMDFSASIAEAGHIDKIDLLIWGQWLRLKPFGRHPRAEDRKRPGPTSRFQKAAVFRFRNFP
jgi:hypothetical protein